MGDFSGSAPRTAMGVLQKTKTTTFLFVDRSAELEPNDKAKLEAAGFIVVEVVGDPEKVTKSFVLYKTQGD